MTDRSRRLAYDILKDVEAENAYSNILLNERLQGEEGADPALVRRLVHGVLNNQILLDYQIRRFLRKSGLKRSARILLRLGFYQLAFCEDIPNYTAVDETVAVAKDVMKGGEGFINAVLRSFARSGCEILLPDDPLEALSVRYSVQPWIAKLWLKSYGQEKAEFLLTNSLEPAALNLRPNPLKTEKQAGFDLENGIAASKDYKNGLFSIQDASALEAVRVLDPKPGEKVLDLCSAPGGKTCAMAERMENKGSILACDIHAGKLDLVKKEAKRLGISIIRICARDGSAELPGEEKGAYDAVLCDVPCSGLGVLRRKPEIKLRLQPEDIEALLPLQAAILRNAGEAVRPGGRLLYSTCTADPAENEDMTNTFVSDGRFEVLSQRQIFTGEPVNGSPGDGFYYCLMRKKDL